MSDHHWLSRISPHPELQPRDLIKLEALDPYGQHQALCKLFNLPPKTHIPKPATPFLFRAERIDSANPLAYAETKLQGLPLFYMLSAEKPEDTGDIWAIESKPFKPVLTEGDRLAFKLRANPIKLEKVERTAEEAAKWKERRSKQNFKDKEIPSKKRLRHDVVMGAKRSMNWEKIPMTSRPSLDAVAYEAGQTWLLARQEKLGCHFETCGLRVDGYNSWRHRNIEVSTLDFEGILIVSHPNLFMQELYRGIGPAKAFGCGLLLVRRI